MGLFVACKLRLLMIKATKSKRLSSMAVCIVIGHIVYDSIIALNSNIANDEARWITTKSNDRRQQ